MTCPGSSTPTWPPPAASHSSANRSRRRWNPDGPAGQTRPLPGPGAAGPAFPARRPQPTPRGSGARAGQVGAAQLQPHLGASAVTRARGHLAALGPGQLPHDVEAEPDTAEPAPVTRLALHETLEDALVITRGDADSLVIDGDLDPLSGRPRPHRDRPAAR